MLFKMNIRLPTPYLKKFLMLANALYFTSSYLEKPEKTPPFEEIPYALRMRGTVFYIVLPGENREDSSIGRIPVSEDVKDKEILFMSKRVLLFFFVYRDGSHRYNFGDSIIQ